MDLPEDFDPLALDNQLCFSLYVCSKEIIRRYQPLLEPLGLTYTMYITLLSLWEKDNVTVKELGKTLFLDSGTLTPVLKKLEGQSLVKRNKSMEDERSVIVCLTKEGHALKKKCMDIPQKMACSNILDLQKAPKLLAMLHEMMQKISDD
ncbi:MAG: MarR family transcriptional regulator [Treponema sp.]|nr:MarR family transcriptional regulator [Treponema sp.]